eukprot:937452-Rhodomonas_salina.1
MPSRAPSTTRTRCRDLGAPPCVYRTQITLVATRTWLARWSARPAKMGWRGGSNSLGSLRISSQQVRNSACDSTGLGPEMSIRHRVLAMLELVRSKLSEVGGAGEEG